MAESENNNKPLDIKKILFHFFRYKYLFVILCVAFLAVAYFKNKLATPIYMNSTKFVITTNTNNQMLASNEYFRGMQAMSTSQNAQNELGFLQSFTLVKQTLKEMDVKVGYYEIGRVFEYLPMEYRRNIYKGSVYEVIINDVYDQPTYVPFHIQIINKDEFRLKATSSKFGKFNYLEDEYKGWGYNLKVDDVYKFGEPISNEYFNFTVVLRNEFQDWMLYNEEKPGQMFWFVNLEYLANAITGSLSINADFVMNSIVEVALRGDNYYFITEFLNEYTTTYINTDLERKNNAALQTIDFIDNQISTVSDTLSTVERQLQSFRSINKVANLSYQGEQLLERFNILENEKAQINTRIKYYNYISDYFKLNSDISDLVAPSVMGLNNLGASDPVLNNLIQSVLELNAERLRLLGDDNTKNLYLQGVESQIENIKSTILENIQNSLETSTITLDDLNERLSEITREIQKLPGTERQLIGIERKSNVYDAIYTYLLEKRAEAQIARASNSSDIEIIDPARPLNPSPVAPNKKVNYILALFASLAITVGFVILKDFFDTKLREAENIKDFDNMPNLGTIANTKIYGRSKEIGEGDDNSMLAEAFRDIRANLVFFATQNPIKVITITSSVSGEGKTFTAKNLASVLTMNNKKVVLVDFDLRKPQIHKEFNLQNSLGVSSFLINACNLEDIYLKTSIENLDVITAGPKPPNPSELVTSVNTSTLIEILKNLYDYIIIDTSPVGLVSETFYHMQNSDLSVFVVRLDYSEELIVNKTIASINKKNINNLSLLINGSDLKSEGYKYKYGKKYYTSNETRRFSLFPKRKKNAS
jgi:tyrosine-protein kinase Etk/Wzc